MQFTRQLRDGVRSGDITTSIRIWLKPRVKVGNSYAMQDGFIVVDALHEIRLDDITPQLARASGFKSVVDLLKVARHGRGMHVYLVQFHFMTERP